MTKLKHTGLLKLAAIIFAVLMAHSGAFSGSSSSYAVSPAMPVVPSISMPLDSVLYSQGTLSIRCPEDISVFSDLDKCSAHIVEGLDIEVNEGSIASLAWKMEGATDAASPLSGINQITDFVFNVGVTFVHYTAIDITGVQSVCSFSVVVTDKQAPEISVPENITIGCNERVPSPYTTLQALLNAGGNASDNCYLNPATFKLVSEEKSNANCPYTIIRTYQIADRQGNVGQAQQLILVEKRPDVVLQEEEGALTLKSGMAVITSTAIGGNWNTGTSWVGGAVPLPGDDIIIVSGATISLTGNQICNDITINGTLNCGIHTLQANGSWTNNGTFNAGTGTVEFAGASNAAISGSSATVFRNFRIAKGAVANVLQINKDITLGGTITFTSGLVQVNSGATVNCSFNTGFTIANIAGIFINGGIFTGGAFQITNNGLFRIDSGTASLGSNSGNSIVVGNSGTIDINGGTVNIAGRLEVSGGTADISGGTINLNTVGHNSSAKGSLDLSLASKFSMSAGTINFLNPNGTGNFDVIMLNGTGGVKNFTGGVFNFGDGTTDTYKISSAVPFPSITAAANTSLQFRRLVTSTGTFSFPLVNNLGNSIPATVQLAAGTIAAGAFIDVNTTGSKFIENKTTGNFLNRYWNVATNGITNPSFNVTATYANADIAGDEAKIAMGAWTGSRPWVRHSAANTATNTITTSSATTGTNLVFAGIANDPPTVSIVNGASTTICNGNSIALTTSASGDPVITYSWSPATGLSATNIPNPVASPTATTTYTVTVTDGNGFTATDNIVVNVNLIPAVNLPVNQTVCSGASTSAVNFTGTGTSHNWTNSNTAIGLGASGSGNIPVFSATNSTSGTISGTITVTPVYSNGGVDCTGPAKSFTITVNPIPTVNSPASQIVCNGASTNAVNFTGTGTSYSWTNSNTAIGLGANGTGSIPAFTATNSTTNVINSTITVTPIYSNGGVDCTGPAQSFTISVIPTPTVNSVGNQTVCNGTSTTLVNFNGTASTFTWTNSNAAIGLATNGSGNIPGFTATNNTTNPITGTITVTPVFSNGGVDCSGPTQSFTITVTPSISASANVTDVIKCFGGTANVLISASGGTPPYTFNFPGKPSNQTGVFSGVIGSVAGTNYNWSVTDALNCAAASGSINVTQPEELTANATASSITCNGLTSTVTITASGGTPPLSYTFNGVTKNNGTFTGITAGTYTWSVKDANNCTPVTGTLPITQPAPITITSANVTAPVTCNGGTGTVTIVATGGTGALSYTFNGQTNATGVFSGVYAGNNLSYSVKDANNCGPAFGSITVNEPTAITATAAVSTAITCNGGTATVTITAAGGSGALSYTFNGVTQASNIFTGVTPGNNIPWSVTDANNCGPVSGTLNIAQPAALTASVSETTSIGCFGGTANIQITAAGGTGTKTYSFQGQPNNQTGIFNAIPGAVAPGTPYSWSVTDANGCSTSGTHNVVQPAQIVIGSIGSNSPICQGETLNLTSAATGGTGTLRYSWTGPNGYTANNAQNPSIVNATPSAGGTYTLTVTDANNCTATSTVNATVNATPTLAKPADQTVCHNASTTAVNFPGPNTYTWTNSDPTIGLGASGTGSIAPFFANNTGTTPVTATITVTPSGNGCTGTVQTFTITVNPVPEVTATNNTPILCDDGVTNIVLSSNVSGTTFSWIASRTSGSTSGFSSGSGTSITHTLSNAGTVDYIITPTANGCVGATATVSIEVISSDYDLNVNVTGSHPATVCSGYAFNLGFTGNSGSGNSGGWYQTQWEWVTRFTWTNNNISIGLGASGGPVTDPGSISFTTQNTTEVDQTATITITPWSFYRSRSRWFWESWPAWPAWQQLCSGNAYSTTITVNPFAITCPADIAANTDANECFATITQPAPALSCGSGANISWTATGATPASGNDGLSGVRFPKGTTTVNYTATRGGITRNCSFKVTVTDSQAPVISNCPPATTTLAMQSGSCGAPFSFNPTATDNCSPFTFVRTDGTGLNSGDIFPAGTTRISYLATDEAGNTATCSFDVVVSPDNQPPAITCAGNQTGICAPAGSGYTMLGTAWDATVVENCPGAVTKTYVLSGATTGTGTSLNNVQFNVGTTRVTWTAKDILNNTSTCFFDVEVTQSPEVTSSPASQTVCLDGSLTFTATATGAPVPTFQWRKNGTPIPGATSASLTLNTIVAGDAGTYDVEVTNSCGSAISAPAVLTVSTLPMITQQPASQSDCRGETVIFRTTVVGGSGNYSYYWESKRPADANFRDATRNNNWVTFPADGEMLVPNLGNARSPDQTQYRVTVTDDCGKSVTSDAATLSVNQITNIDLVLSTICQGFGTSFTVTTSGSTPIVYQWRRRNALGNWVNVNDGGAYSGATTATLTINNATTAESGDYSARAQFNITVPNNNNATTCWENDYTLVGTLTVDEGPAIVATPANQTICSGKAITEIVLTDTNGIPGTTFSWTRDNSTILTGMPVSGNGATINGTLTSLDPTNLQTTVFTITATTANGCVSTGQVSVSVGDVQDPTVATCPTNISVDATAGICGAVVNYTAPTFADNCDGTGLSGTLVAGLASGAEFPVGTTTVTYEFTDAAGNGPVSCSFDVTVTDKLPPVVICQPVIVELDATGNVAITAADIDNGTTDNCGVPTLSIDITSFDCTDLGPNTVTLTATDGTNTATCTATVTVEDNILPTAVCKNATIQLDATGNAAITATDIDNGSTDNCGIASMTVSPNTFDCSNIGTNTVELTVTDLDGNIAKCTATVTVEDKIAPSAVCKNITVQLDATGNATITANDIDNGSTDNCGIASMSVSQSTFNCTTAGANTVTLTVTDVNGNSSTCNATVTIEDNVDPVALCKDITIQLDAAGNASITPANIDNGSTDNCGIPVLTIDINTFDCTKLGDNTVTLTATDGVGNTHSCAAIVTVADDNFPVAITANVSQTTIDCFGETATVTITKTSGGVGTLTYTFNGVSNATGIFNNIPAGNAYAWSVTNPLGCGNISGTFNVIQPQKLSANVTITDVTCSNNDATITISNPQGGSGNYEFTNNGGTTWQTALVFSGLVPGTYNVQMRDANVPSCKVVLNSNVTVHKLSADHASTNVTCFGSNDGTITISDPHGGSNSYQYTVNGGTTWVNTANFTGLAPGTYDVRIRDANEHACELTLDAALQITQPDVLGANIASTSMTCNGDNNGTITVSLPTGGYGTYQVSINGTNWFNVTTAAPHVFTNLAAGSYTAQIRDAAQTGCTINLNPVTITEPAVLAATVNSTNVTCFGSADGTISITSPTGGFGTYEYSINGGGSWQSSGSFSSLSPGAYDIRIRDAAHNACQITLNGNLIITEPLVPNVIVPSDQPVCNGASTTAVSFTGDVPGTVFKWTNNTPSIGLAVSGTGDIASFTAVNTGNTVVTATITVTPEFVNGGVTCTGTPQTFTYVVYPTADAVATPSAQTLCTGGTTAIALSSGVSGATFDWTVVQTDVTGASDGSGNTIAQTLTATGTSAGTATYTIIPTANGCPGTPTIVVVTVNPEPQVNQPLDQEICNGTSTGMITFSTSNTAGTTTYTWINSEPLIGLAAAGSGSIIAPFTGTNAGTQPLVGTITVTPHLSNGGITCDGPSKTFTITVNPQPRATAPIGLTYCNGILSDPYPLAGTPSGVLFDISGGASIGLADVAGVSEIPAFTPTAAGTASLTIVPKYNGCTGLPVSFNVTVRPTPIATMAGGATVCQNAAPPSITITNPMNLAVLVTYTINGTITNTVNIPSKSNVSIAVPTNAAGTFTYDLVSVQYLDSNPPVCPNNSITGTATVEVTALPVPVITGPTDICAETTSHVYSTEAGMSNYTWVVSSAGTITAGGSPTDNTVTVTWNTGGSHNISVRYNNANGCGAPVPTIFPVNVFTRPIPTITGSTSACLNTSKVYSTQPGMTNYLWNVSAGATITAGGGVADNSVTVTWSGVGAQTVSVNYTTLDGCDAPAQTVKNITVNPLPNPTITGPARACAGTNGNVYTTEPGMSTYVWVVSVGGTVTSGGSSNSNTATIRWNTDGPQTVSISYLNPATGCTPASATVYNVSVDPMPVPTIVGLASVCVGATGITYTSEPGMSNYVWTVSAGGTRTAGGGAADNFVTVSWNTAGANSVRVNYQNANGCSATTATIRNVTVNPLPNPVIAGTVQACVGSTITYSTLAGMSNYQWTIPAGATVVSGGSATDNQVKLTWTATGNHTISLNYTNANGCSALAPTNYAVTVNALPTPTITGPADACKGGAVTVYTTQPGMVGYIWTISGGTITAGGSANDNTATVVWNTVGTQTIGVNYYNANNCAAAAPFVYPVNVLAPAPPTCPINRVVCSSDVPFNLTGGLPVGGAYAGPGVTLAGGNYVFSPATAGPGVHTITYTMPNICADQCSFTITVNETPIGSATPITICSGYPTDLVLNSTVPGTTFTWTASVTSGSVTGFTNCSGGSCGNMIKDTLTNNLIVNPGQNGANAVVRYVVTATKDGCSSTFNVNVTVRPQVKTYNLTWNSNFVEDFIEVCAGAEALSDNDIEVLDPSNGNLVGSAQIPATWNPTFLYGPSPAGPWTSAPGSWKGGSYYEWLVDFSINNRLGYHYFILQITDPVTGCIKYSNPAILNVVSALVVEAGDPEFICGGSSVPLTGSYVGGLSSSTIQGRWTVTNMSPAHGNNGTLSNTNFTTNPAGVSYTPPNGYIGTVTLTLTTNDPSGVCAAVTDTRTVTVAPPTSFLGCRELAGWPLTGTNSNGSRDDSEEPCLVTLVGSDNLSGSAGNTNITHCTGVGNISFNWTFLAPPNKIVWHQEDQTSGSNSSTTNLRVARPTNVVAGDLIIITVHINDNNLNFTPGNGFTQIINTTHNSRTATVASFYKIATGSEPANYNIAVGGGNVGSNDRIYASRVTGHNVTTPIGGSNGTTLTFPYTNGENGYRNISIAGFPTGANTMLVAALAVDINNDNVLEFSNAPIGMTTVYYDDNETSTRVATAIVSGNTGTRRFQWPSYNSRNRETMYAAAQMFTINPATNERDEAFFTVNGNATLLGNTNGASGSRTVSVASGDVFGFRVGTLTNTGGPGRLVIYNLTMPNDTPVLTGKDSVFVDDCQNDAFLPTFEDPTVTDDCGIPVVKTGYPVTDVVVSNGCARSQKRTWVYVDDCGQESLPFTQTAVWSVLAPITLSCPVDPMLEPCTDPAVITARYNDWVAGFVATGGCSMTTNSYAVPPLILANIACGDTLYFKFIATDACGQKDSCTSTFTVKPITTLNVVCPADVVLPSCTDTASIRAAYNTWKAGFSYDGGCAAVTDNMIDFPPLTDLTCGAKLEFIYSVFNSCGQNASCVSTFTVEPPQPLSVVVPAGVSLPLCSKTTDIETAYNDWKAGFSYSGGCNVITNIDELPALGDITCGGVITFTYTARNKNSACEDLQEATSTFTVAEAPDLIVSCPVDPNIEGCLGIQAITDAYDTWVDGFRASGGCNITTNIASIPPLGDLVCNGQLTFTFIVGNDSELCSDHVECTSTFTIGAAPQLQVIVPADTVMRGCNTSQEAMDAFNAWKTQFSHTGGCNVSASDLSIYGLPSSCGGTVTVKYTVWDNCSQMVTDSAKFTLNPDYISVNAPIDEIQPACQTQAEIDEAFDIWKAKFRFSGGCGTVGTDLSVIDAPDACGGTIVVNYSAQDVCGQVVNTSAIFTIDAPSDVLQEPSFTVPPAVTIYRDNACAYDARPGITGFPSDLADNCTAAGNLNMTHSDSTAFGSCSSELIIFRTWIVSDNCLNQTSKMQIITVTDSIPPVVLCAADVNGVADNGECDATNVALGNTTATDNCALASFEGVRSDGLSITDPFPVGVTTITWTAIDACGNTSTCIQTVTLVDGITQPPVITCPADVEQNAGPNNCYLENVSIPNPSATDNCEVATISWVMTGATTGSSVLTGFNYVGGETFNVGVTTVTYTATDSAGNYATCAFKVTIKDVTPPVIAIGSCVDISENAAPNNCSKVPATLIDPDYSDTCWPKDSLRLSWVLTGATTGSGQGTLTNQSFNVGLTTVVVTVTDPDGNTDDCSFTVTILDVTDPVIDISSCANVSEVADADNCSKTPLENMDPTYSDNCWPVDSLDLTYVITGATTGSGSGSVTGLTFNVGVSTVEYTVTDPDGNSASCSFTVTIIDVTPPVINLTLCADVTDVAAPNNCSKVPGDLKDPDYSDTCWPKDSLTISWTMTGATTGSGFGTVTDSAFHVGVTTVTYTVTDPDNNSASCSFTVTIKDVTPPNIDIAGCENVTDVTDDGNCAVVPGNIDDPVYSDACWDVADLTITWQMTGATTGSGTGSVVGQSFNAGVTTVKYVVSDPDGNKDSCSFTVTIIPYNPPAFRAGCPPDIISAPNDPGICEADLTIPDPTVDDPCNIGYTIKNNRTGTNNASGVYPVGTTEVIWTIMPTVGDTTTCTQMITVTDQENPIIVTCPETLDFDGCNTDVIAAPAFSASVANSSYTEFSNATNGGVATDNCAIDSVTYIDVMSGGICPIVITRTWTVFDAAGNWATCNQTININDIVAPVVDCPDNDSIPSDFNLPYSDYTLPSFGFSDNCTDSVNIRIDWTISGVTNDSGNGLIPSPYRFNRGLNIISYTFADACGNETICEFTLFVLFPPDIECLPPLTYDTDSLKCTHRLPTGPNDPGVPGNITGDLLNWEYTIFNPDGSTAATGSSTGVTASPIDPYDFMLGTSTIRWVGVNASGSDTCSQLVTVVDNGSPTFAADPFEDCVESLSSAVYTGNADDIQYNPDYPDGDYKIMNPGDPYLDIDLGTYVDNCCVLADGYSLFWTIEFDGSDPNEPDITGTGQPSTYKDPISGAPMEILLWGDGVNFQPRVHTITYTITDCNGNTSDPVVETITINPRPQLIKVTN